MKSGLIHCFDPFGSIARITGHSAVVVNQDIIGLGIQALTQVSNSQGFRIAQRVILRKPIDVGACACQVSVPVGVVDTPYGWPELA